MQVHAAPRSTHTNIHRHTQTPTDTQTPRHPQQALSRKAEARTRSAASRPNRSRGAHEQELAAALLRQLFGLMACEAYVVAKARAQHTRIHTQEAKGRHAAMSQHKRQKGTQASPTSAIRTSPLPAGGVFLRAA
eukprot:scaffold6259_cov122-Isochrysis_galbana.AAC.3